MMKGQLPQSLASATANEAVVFDGLIGVARDAAYLFDTREAFAQGQSVPLDDGGRILRELLAVSPVSGGGPFLYVVPIHVHGKLAAGESGVSFIPEGECRIEGLDLEFGDEEDR